MKNLQLFLICIFGLFQHLNSQAPADSFEIQTVGHGSLLFKYNNLIIHVDPYSSQANYSQLPDADLIFVTHGHSDHYDLAALSEIKKDSTVMVFTQAVSNLGTYNDSAIVMKNGDSIEIKGIPVKAVPAYNLVNTQYHAKETGNGYVLTFGEKRVYIAGDTENIPEMDSLGKIDIAFIPMNLPYTMSVSMAEEAALSIRPDILYIYHFGGDTAQIRSLLTDEDFTIRIGKSVHRESTLRSEIPASVNIAAELSGTLFYPNPVKDILHFESRNPNTLITVYDLNGRLLKTYGFINEGEHRVNLKHLSPGKYILKITNRNGEETGLLIKE